MSHSSLFEYSVSASELNRWRAGLPLEAPLSDQMTSALYPRISQELKAIELRAKEINDLRERYLPHSTFTKVILAQSGDGKTSLCHYLKDYWGRLGRMTAMVSLRECLLKGQSVEVALLKAMRLQSNKGSFDAVDALEVWAQSAKEGQTPTDLTNPFLLWLARHAQVLTDIINTEGFRQAFWLAVERNHTGALEQWAAAQGLMLWAGAGVEPFGQTLFYELNHWISKEGAAVPLMIVDDVDERPQFDAAHDMLCKLIDKSTGAFSLVLSASYAHCYSTVLAAPALHNRMYGDANLSGLNDKHHVAHAGFEAGVWDLLFERATKGRYELLKTVYGSHPEARLDEREQRLMYLSNWLTASRREAEAFVDARYEISEALACGEPACHHSFTLRSLIKNLISQLDEFTGVSAMRRAELSAPLNAYMAGEDAQQEVFYSEQGYLAPRVIPRPGCGGNDGGGDVDSLSEPNPRSEQDTLIAELATEIDEIKKQEAARPVPDSVLISTDGFDKGDKPAIHFNCDAFNHIDLSKNITPHWLMQTPRLKVSAVPAVMDEPMTATDCEQIPVVDEPVSDDDGALAALEARLDGVAQPKEQASQQSTAPRVITIEELQKSGAYKKMQALSMSAIKVIKVV